MTMDLETRLQAQITAQNLMIEALLEAAIQAGQLDPSALVGKLEQFVSAPKASVTNPGEIAAVMGEVDAWADMISGRYLVVKDSSPERKPR
ncbi:hypothetical protein KIF53_13385 [Chromobacterium subtsugae]|uniref:Uncharacterized protein n=1 Tax=Chromobacterium subtsugae TaxID=251747 RepID=A0ABS7FF30_9NEIS|nr:MULTISPECIES: hypothetical protein [Chromobacterium]MBW7567059.1 hypothetical protein [Chromobacterium subtsugae]MBW8288622.1 hypothetical protein [Chromobacterium subtsugae]WSE90151.1 hypothetical protein U6115_14775 [Chromobacterium subtsugae]WVH58523.1 hypothetical protein U6151_14800 [Chromobacterium subtsugae]